MQKFIFLFFMLPTIGMAQQINAFQLFDSQGNQVDFPAMAEQLREADVIFFGEQHNNPIAHWMQLELTKALFEETGDKLVLGAEMFEADNQLLLNEYLQDIISEKNFEQEARLWNNYKTDYKPLVLFAKKNQLPFIATNVPRRYANLVYREGLEKLDSLSRQAKSYLAPLPIEVDLEIPSYKNMMAMMGGHGGGENNNIVLAQAIKDATMAHFIATNLPEGRQMLHFNGSYHSDDKEGIIWHLNNYRPGLNIMSITTVEQDAVDSLKEENQGKADFILTVPSTMTKTY